MSTAIEFNNISKQYRLGLVSTRTLSADLNRWWAMSVRGKEDPYLKIGSVNDRASAADSEFVWALRDIDFKVEQGDVVGIIVKNGAGKSTLLKLLSKVTAPTTGTIKARGRIGALLEVGTGFHPEMTGRENIYMNGAIMGMSKQEISRKLDEIVDFSGCERYIDTPVKRYSSGMTVRLGFAVAAHLDPEILVVDEVLAVGDAEFQKKAIGKMQDVSKGEGRTVLFVSHNMTAVKNLCHNCVILENGMLKSAGNVDEMVNKYINTSTQAQDYCLSSLTDYSGNGELLIGSIEINSEGTENGYVLNNQPVKLRIEILNPKEQSGILEVAGIIRNSDRTYVNYFGSKLKQTKIEVPKSSHFFVEVDFAEFPFVPGVYYLGFELFFDSGVGKQLAYFRDEAIQFHVDEVDFYGSGQTWHRGIVLLNQDWRIC